MAVLFRRANEAECAEAAVAARDMSIAPALPAVRRAAVQPRCALLVNPNRV